ncbi:MAG: hypothetical protein ACRERV_12820 [Methylococcales bacterium]
MKKRALRAVCFKMSVLLYQGRRMEIKRTYIVDECNRKIAVQLDIETFEKIEEAIENYGLSQLMQVDEPNNEQLDFDQAREYYQTLRKSQ